VTEPRGGAHPGERRDNGVAARNGLEIAAGSAESFARTVEGNHARWGTIIRRMRLSRE